MLYAALSLSLSSLSLLSLSSSLLSRSPSFRTAEILKYNESVKIEVTGGSGGQTPTRVQVVGVDQGRRGDAGDMHSLRPIDPISECMLREYVFCE